MSNHRRKEVLESAPGSWNPRENPGRGRDNHT